MPKTKYRNLIVIVFALAVICASLLSASSLGDAMQTSLSAKSAARPPSDFLDGYYDNLDGIISPLGIGAWDIYTAFPDSYGITLTDDTLYFGQKAADDRYSAVATLTTPYLVLNDSHQLYTVSFDYFSPRASQLANNIMLYASCDGQDFSKIGEVEKVYNSNENNFSSIAFDVESSVKFLRWELKIYHSDDWTNGIYLKNFDLSPKVAAGIAVPSFTVQTDSLSLGYTSYSQVPSYAINFGNPSYSYVARHMVLDSGYAETESIDLGEYKLLILIYGHDNDIVRIVEKEFEIVQGKITHAEIDYFATADGIEINHINLFAKDRLVTQNLGSVSYLPPADNKTTVTMQESAHFGAFSASDMPLEINSQYLINTANPVRTYIYDGTAKTVEFENTTDKESVVKYFKRGQELGQAPTDAGKYTAEIYIEDNFVKSLTMIINPAEITEIMEKGTEFSRVYDGTTNVYDAKGDDFVFIGQGGEIDDQSLQVENLHFAANIGDSYLVFDKATFGGNFVLSASAVVDKIAATIDKVDIRLQDNLDGEGKRVITVLEKQYDGQDNAIINTTAIVNEYGSIKNAPLNFLGVPQDESFWIDALTANFKSFYAGQNIPVGLTIADATYLDRFNPDIYTADLVLGTIIAKDVNILPSSDIQVVTKPYDAALQAEVVINNVEFDSGIIPSDNAVMSNNDNFALTCSSAEFADANVGTKNVTVKGITLHSKNPQYTQIVNSYEVNDIVISGEIVAKPVEVLDEYFHITTQQSIPDIRTSPAGISLYVSYHHSLADAQNGSGALGDFSTDNAGTYFIRAEMPYEQSNYTLADGYKVIVLEITSQKKAQTLTFGIDAYKQNNVEYGDHYKMAIGGRFSPNAQSQSTHLGQSYDTGLSVIYEGNTGTKLTYAQGVYTAREAGAVTITARQNGNNFYLAAEPVTITIVIVDIAIAANDDIAVIGAPTLYYGDAVPEITGSALFDGQKVSGEYTKTQSSLVAGNADYLYDFVPSERYLGRYIDVGVKITAEKATIKLFISDAYKYYGDDLDFLNFAQILLIKGDREKVLTVDEFTNLRIEFLFSHDIKTLVSQSTPYQIGFDDSFSYHLAAEKNDSFNIIFDGSSFNLTVYLRPITISIIDISKEYGFSGYGITLSIVGCDSQDTAQIADKVTIVEQVKNNSDVGRYVLRLSFDDESFDTKYTVKVVNGYMDIVKASVEFRAENKTSTYLHDTEDATFIVTGFYIEDDRDYYADNITLSHSVTANTSVGEYTIVINGLSNSKNYDFTFVNATYTVTPATLTGITLSDNNFVFDGQNHSLRVIYDKNVWGELSIAYNNYDISAIGRYPITAVVSKENYHNLELSAVLTISSPSISTSSRQTVATITMLDKNIGFDPRATLMLVQNTNAEKLDIYAPLLAKTDDIAENILGVYNFFLTIDGERIEVTGSNQVKIKLEGVGSTTKVRVLANVGGEITEVAHSFQSGYIVFESNATEFAVVKQVSAYSMDTSSLIIAIVLGIIVLIVLYTVFLGYRRKGKSFRKRSIRNHKRWA